MASGKCGKCGPVAVGWAFGLLLVLVCITVAYYITNKEVLGVGQVWHVSKTIRSCQVLVSAEQRPRYESYE